MRSARDAEIDTGRIMRVIRVRVQVCVRGDGQRDGRARTAR
jgi:hypothetical protein